MNLHPWHIHPQAKQPPPSSPFRIGIPKPPTRTTQSALQAVHFVGQPQPVADFQVPLSLETQTGCSVIRPASFTGIFVFKPTHNAISLEGAKAVAPTFDTIGFFARSIEDLELVADVFAQGDDESPTITELKDISVTVIKTPMWPRGDLVQ